MKVTDLVKYEPSLKFIEGSYQSAEVFDISHVDDPQPETFIFIKKQKFLNDLGRYSEQDQFAQTGLILSQDLEDKVDKPVLAEKFKWIATVDNVDFAMCRLSKPFYDQKFGTLNYHVDGRQMNSAEVDPDAEIAQGVFIGEGCKIGAGVTIMPGAVIMPKVIIGAGTIIYPNVTIYPYCEIGTNNRIHSGTVIGTDGFGYNFFEGKHQKIWHLAGVKTANEVEIGCNAMLDAGTFAPTYIGEGSKIDNDVQISHNVRVHKHVIICGTTGIAGSVEIFDYCAFGAGAGVAPSAKIMKGAQVAGRAVVSENAIVPEGVVMAGHPARPLKEWLRSQANLRKLDKK